MFIKVIDASHSPVNYTILAPAPRRSCTLRGPNRYQQCCDTNVRTKTTHGRSQFHIAAWPCDPVPSAV